MILSFSPLYLPILNSKISWTCSNDIHISIKWKLKYFLIRGKRNTIPKLHPASIFYIIMRHKVQHLIWTSSLSAVWKVIWNWELVFSGKLQIADSWLNRVLPWYWHLVMQCWLDILPLSSWNVLNDPWSHLRDSVTIPICIGSLAPSWNYQALIYFNLWPFATSRAAHKVWLTGRCYTLTFQREENGRVAWCQ